MTSHELVVISGLVAMARCLPAALLDKRSRLAQRLAPLVLGIDNPPLLSQSLGESIELLRRTPLDVA